jgi:hypothetical protein
MGDSPTTHDELCMYYFPLQGYLTILFRILFISFVYVGGQNSSSNLFVGLEPHVWALA